MAKDEIEVAEPVFDSGFADEPEVDDDLFVSWFMKSLFTGVFDSMLDVPTCCEPEEDIEKALQKDHEAYIKALESGAFDWMMADLF